MNPGERLGTVQMAGGRSIDRLYAVLAAAIHAAIMRRATPDQRGILRLSLPARAAILSDLGRLLDNARLPLVTAIMGAVQAAEVAATKDGPLVVRDQLPSPVGVDDASRGIPLAPMVRSTETSLVTWGVVWRSLGTDRASVIGQTGALLVRGIAAGVAASVVAAVVRQYFSPFFAPRRDEAGKLLRADRVGAVSAWPGRAGMASQHPRTIMLTETTAAHARSQLAIALYGDQLVKYTLSPQHSKADECSSLATADSGWGSGVYLPRDAPRVPQHPRCRCHLVRVDRPAREDAA